MAQPKSFIQRSLIPATVLASVTTVVTGAQATNLTNFSYGDWSSKSTAAGSFGAGYGAGFTVDFVSGALTGNAYGNADIQLFGSSHFRIIDLEATASINDSSADAASLSASIVGVEVYSQSFSDGYTFDASEDVTDYEDTFCTEFFDLSTTVMVVVVPVTLSAGATGCTNLTFSAVPQYVTSTHKGTLNMDVTPSLDTSLTVAAGVGAAGFSAGVEASVTLLNVSIPVSLDPSYTFTTQAFSYESAGSVDLTMLDGSVGLYAEADLGLFDVRYEKTLFDWGGISESWALWSTGEPTAGGPSVSIDGATATGEYVYADTAGTPEGESIYAWYRNSTSSGSGTAISDADSATHIIEAADSGKYLKFCVTPKNAADTEGIQQCSAWRSVGKVAAFYKNNNYGGDTIAVAYEKSPSGTCFNLDDYGGYPDNSTSSHEFFAPSSSQGTINLYKDHDCTNLPGSNGFRTQTVAAGGSHVNSNLSEDWDNRISSIMVIANEKVTAEGVRADISGDTASAAYAFTVGNSTNDEESGTTYVWKRSSYSSGASPTTLNDTGSSRHLVASDNEQYLRVCVTPSNGTTTGPQACSPWTAVGHLVMFRAGGDIRTFAYEKSKKSHCFKMSDFGFDNEAVDSAWFTNAQATSTLSVYTGSSCTGTVATQSLAANADAIWAQMTTTFGSGWSATMSSFKIDWTSTVSITTPALSIYGNTATESHTYTDTAGLAESAMYTWYRASDSSGTGKAAIANALSDAYTLAAADNNKYLQVCVLSSNGSQVSETEKCSSWTSVGPVTQLFADSSSGGASIVIAYSKSPSGTCFNLADFQFDDVLSSTTLTAPTSVSATQKNYKDANCTGTVGNKTAAAGSSVSYNTNSVGIENKSSFKVDY